MASESTEVRVLGCRRRTGALRSLGPAGNAVAATWNASLAGLGALQAAFKGPRNQGETLKTPKTYETEQERRTRQAFEQWRH